MWNILEKGIRIFMIWGIFSGLVYATPFPISESDFLLDEEPPLPETVFDPERKETVQPTSTSKSKKSPDSYLKKNYASRIVSSTQNPRRKTVETTEVTPSRIAKFSAKAKNAVIPPEKQISLYFPATATVEKSTYSLGEIAQIEGEDLILIEKLAPIEIGRSPLPGSSLVATRALILSRLRPHIPSERISFPGTDHAKIQRAALMIPGPEIDQAVLEHISDQYPGTEIKPKLLSRSRDIYLPKGEMTFAIHERKKHKKEGGYRTYNVEFYIDEKLEKTLSVRTYLKVYKDIYIAKDTIKQNQVIRDKDLQKERRNIDQLPSAYITDKSNVVGKLAKRAINPKEVLKKNALDQPPLVKKGEQLLIVYETPGLRLTAQGIAMSKGHLGERIPVRNMESSTIVYAKVKSKTQVHVN